MSNQGSSSAGEGPSSPQPGAPSSAVNSNIQGNYSGNSGSHNITGSGNIMNSGNINSGPITNNYHGGTNSTPSYAEILQVLYTFAYESHRDRVREPVEGTCTWVTEHEKYEDWLAKKTSGPLWLSADHGCGKSVIASFLVEHLRTEPDTIVSYFFFNEKQRNATFALCAILHQLFMKKNSLYIHAAEQFEAKGKSFTEEVHTLWNILVKAVAEWEHGEVICVVDALDECEEKTRAQLIRHMARFAGSQPSSVPLKFLVTSRPYREIETELGTPETTIRLKGEDEVNAITIAITSVIDEGIRGLESRWGKRGRLGYLRDLLESSADRTFLWVSLVLDLLKDSEDDSRGNLTDIASTAPHDLAELYTKILDKSKDPETARRILHIVIGAARPLTLPEIYVAFRIKREHMTINNLGDFSPEFGTIVKNVCGLFVRVTDSKVYLVHQTAREFLIKESLPGQGEWQYSICVIDSNLILADICISYLALADFQKDPLAMDPIHTPRGARREAIRNYIQKYTFLDYAATHWADHFQDSQNRQMELFESTRLICEHGSNRFLTWFKVYWADFFDLSVFPPDLTHLMIASLLGQQTVVDRLLKEGGDINARSKRFGTALNIAGFRNNRNIAKTLMKRGVNAYIYGKEYNILLTRRRELERVMISEHD